MTIREATSEETQGIAAELMMMTEGLWVCLAINDEGERTGRLCLTISPYGVFGHNTTFETSEEAIALWRAALAHLSELGIKEYFVHLEPGTPKRTAEFWLERTEPAFVCLKALVTDNLRKRAKAKKGTVLN